MMTTCLNIAIPAELSDILGWLMIGVTSFNIVTNLSLVGLSSVKQIIKNRKMNAARKRVQKFLEVMKQINQ